VNDSVRDSRDLKRLSSEHFDILVVGGGAAGAATAREAALRGFKTALIEREDFSAGASAHCFKVVHGGIRYLQHADLKRLRASCHERAVLLRIAPHLVAPLPFVVPTYGRGRSSRWFLGTGMLLYDALTADINRHVTNPDHRIQRTRFLSRQETLGLFPAIDSPELTGAAVFEDGQMYNAPRLVLAFIRAAATLGATVANYVEAERLLAHGSRIVGVAAVDRLSGASFEIKADLVINAAGPWAEGLLQRHADQQYGPAGSYSRDACFLVSRRSTASMALAIQGRSRDSDALLARGARHLFLVPWRNYTLIGVWHALVPREPDRTKLSHQELLQFLDEVNACYPALAFAESEIRRVDFGLVPFGESSRQKGGLSFGKQSRLIDHREYGVTGLLSLISVRYTVARRDAADALRLAEAQLGPRNSGEESDWRPLHGGDCDDITALERTCMASSPHWLPSTVIGGLVRNYGTEIGSVMALANSEPQLRRFLSGTHVSCAEAVYSVRHEMAQRMTDVVFRRTELGTAGHPGYTALFELQQLLAREFQWSHQRAADELAAVEAEFGRYLARAPQTSEQVRTA
jgi:glycerol-3-phosphate dehydrogenase